MEKLIDSKFEFLILEYCYGLYSGIFVINEVVSELYCSYPHSLAHQLCVSIFNYFFGFAL